MKKKKSILEVFIHGNSIIFCEYHSKGMIEEIVKLLEKNYGVVSVKKCHSMCG